MEKGEEYEIGFEAFKSGVILQELCKEKGLALEELAQSCGTSKTFISKIENYSSDVKLPSLMKVLHDGFGGKLKLEVELL